MAMSRQLDALRAVLDVADWHNIQAMSLEASEPRLATVHRDAARRIRDAIARAILNAIGGDDE